MIPEMIGNWPSKRERQILTKMYENIHKYGVIKHIDLMCKSDLGFDKYTRFKKVFLHIVGEEIKHDSYTEMWYVNTKENGDKIEKLKEND